MTARSARAAASAAFPTELALSRKLNELTDLIARNPQIKNPNLIYPGQKVVVESDTKKMLKIVSFVYLIPVILFLAGYLIMLACNTSVAVQYTAAVAGAVLGILLAIWYDRRVKARGGLSFTIVRVF